MDKYVFTKDWLDNGKVLYKRYNNSENRVKLEVEAAELMRHCIKWKEYEAFLEGNFLKWMRARTPRKIFITGLKGADGLHRLFDEIKDKRNGYSCEEICVDLLKFCKIDGVGPVLSSAMLTLIDPYNYGIVNRHTLEAINQYFDTHMETVNVGNSTIAIGLMRTVARYIEENSKIKCRSRDVDMALWGYGKELVDGQ